MKNPEPYRISYCITLALTMSFMGERPIKPARVYFAECLLDEKSVKEITALLLSNDTVTH